MTTSLVAVDPDRGRVVAVEPLVAGTPLSMVERREAEWQARGWRVFACPFEPDVGVVLDEALLERFGAS